MYLDLALSQSNDLDMYCNVIVFIHAMVFFATVGNTWEIGWALTQLE